MLHCCRSTRLPEPPDPTRALFPTVHKTGAIGAKAMSGDAIAEMIQRRAGQAGYGPAQTTAVGRALAASRVCHRGVPGRRGRPRDHATNRTPLPGDARGLRPGTRPAGRQRRHPPRPLADDQPDRHTATDEQPRVLSARTRRTYAADWALFTDWCAATDTTAAPRRPARPSSTSSPGAPPRPRRSGAGSPPSTTTTPTAGLDRPGESVAVRAALGRPTGEPFQPTDEDKDAVEAALRGLPSHGWTAGCSAAGTGPCWCCPNWRGCRIDTSPPSPPATSPYRRRVSRRSGPRRGSGPFVRPTTRSCAGRARSRAG